MNDEIFRLLEKNTSKNGSYSLELNPHKISYRNSIEDIESYYTSCDNLKEFKEKTKNINWSKNIYYLIWHINTPVGFVDIISNNIEDLRKQILEVIEND